MRNAGPIFCRMVKVISNQQLGINIFAYMDDVVVATKKKKDRINDLAETFRNTREANLKLNPEKCVFEV